MHGTLVITPGSDASHICVAWQSEDSTTVPVPAEERGLVAGTPQTLGVAFDNATSNAALKKVGEALWECLAGGAAGVALQQARDQGLNRIFLDLTDTTTAWKGLPWEVLYDGGSWLGQQTELSVTRCHRAKTAALATGWPFRFLVVCGEPESDTAIQVRAELEAIEDGLWRRRREIITRTLIHPPEKELRESLLKFQPHVLHFIGHGTGDALQIRKPADNSVWRWTADKLRTWLSNGKAPTPRLVFLNACHTQSATSGADSASLAQTFLKIGVPAVIGLSGAVEGEAAQVLARCFYRQWIDGEDLDAAITEARAQIATSASLAAKPRQAHLPCLTVNQTPTQWMRWPKLPPKIGLLLQDTELDRLHREFVDRNAERCALFDCWLPYAADKIRAELPVEPVVLLLHGPRQGGKTDALRMVLKAMLTRGWIARWHRISGSGSMDWLKLLNQLLDGDPLGGELARALPGATFAAYRKFAGKPVKIDAEGDMTKGFEHWCAGLQQLLDAQDAQNKLETPVALALDALGLVASPAAALPSWLEVVARHLITPLLSGGLKGPFLLALVLADDELAPAQAALATLTGRAVQKLDLRTFDPAQIVRPAMLAVPVGRFEPEDAERAAKQYFRQRWQDEVESRRHLLSEAKIQMLQVFRDLMLQTLVDDRLNLLGESLPLNFEPVTASLTALIRNR